MDGDALGGEDIYIEQVSGAVRVIKKEVECALEHLSSVVAILGYFNVYRNTTMWEEGWQYV